MGERRLHVALDRGWLSTRIVTSPVEIQRCVAAQGLVCLDKDRAPPGVVVRAEAWVGALPTLSAVVASVVDDLHLLEASPGYDVSHSEPQWPARIFVSIPDRSDDIGALRFVEGIVHEAMHLQLTLFENQQPIVADLKGTMPSPWRSEDRPFGGVVHGLYVFTCLRSLFLQLAPIASGASQKHLEGRVREIQAEIASIDVAELTPGLTSVGADLARGWHARSVAPP